jgi:Right handed beta helix region
LQALIEGFDENHFSATMGRLGATVAGTDPCSTGGHPKLQQKKRRLQMNKFRFTIKVMAIATFLFAFASMAQAQATRTWVSGVGDDANPCSRTAPCKTFAGAISKTAKDGEISVLDPGGFGTISITKSITINGTHGAGFGSILASFTFGVSVNITDAADLRKSVRLVALNINGASTGTNGVQILAATRVSVEDTIIDGFTNRGISDTRTNANAQLFVTDCTVRNTVQSGVVVLPGANGSISAVIDNLRSEGSTSNGGASFDASAAGSSVKATVRNSFLAGHSAAGINIGGNSTVAVQNCVLSHNGQGISAGAPATMVLEGSFITNNTTSIVGPAQVSSAGDNIIMNNNSNVLPSGPPATQG